MGRFAVGKNYLIFLGVYGTMKKNGAFLSNAPNTKAQT